ncbi:MAG: Ku70/Ku80 beta-barrel domain protein [Methanosaeta sp. PtaU1.Bin112]|nr:MAG: Ku70/Ku80 beta-barrel domain protein [Methanosaeta sp. PtaU1.Bin112]
MPEVVQLAGEKREKTQEVSAAEASSTTAFPRTSWSGSLSIGLVNIPVKAMLMTKDMRISFRMLHRSCKTAISFKRFCQEGEEVSLADIVYGYPLGNNRYAVLEKKEIEEARPESKSSISLDRFVNFFEIDPHYFEKTYLLLPDRSEEAYSLMREVMEKTAKAAIGRITFHTRERPVLVHYYRQALVATTMRYPEEVLDPQDYQAIRDLPRPQEKELELALQIVNSLSGELDLSAYHDRYKERIEGLVRSKMEGIVSFPEKKKSRSSAKSLMEALRLTAESLK